MTSKVHIQLQRTFSYPKHITKFTSHRPSRYYVAFTRTTFKIVGIHVKSRQGLPALYSGRAYLSSASYQLRKHRILAQGGNTTPNVRGSRVIRVPRTSRRFRVNGKIPWLLDLLSVVVDTNCWLHGYTGRVPLRSCVCETSNATVARLMSACI